LRGGILAERFGLAHRTLFLQPTIPTRAFPHFALPVGNLGLGALNRWSHSFVFSQVWRELSEAHNAMRVSLGLTAWARQPSETELPSSINLFSPELVPRPKDWGTAHQVVGFAPLRPEDRSHATEAKLPDDLNSWLDAGDSPVFFGFGSMPVYRPQKTLRDIETLCKRLGIRALIGAGWTDYGAGSSNENVFIAGALDHERVLPRCRAAVHHGGAGTTHTALRAGLPSLVCSFSVDQPFWGRRLKRLGVGDTLPFRKLNLRALMRRLPPLLDEHTQARAARIGARLRKEDGARRTVDLIETEGAPSGIGRPRRQPR
jgi:UDP:flavonoid glycosyltransferase YjiC (YdhE family)